MLPLVLSTLSIACIGALATPLDFSLERRAPATIYAACTTPDTVAVTFDDGPHIYLDEIVNTLDAAGAKGTFFFNGNNFGCIYATENIPRIKNAYDRGHQVASHTWAHKDLATLTWDEINDEMWRVEGKSEALLRIVGASAAFMRPPFGSYNVLVLEASGARRQSIAIWDFDSRDTAGATAQESKDLYDDIANQRPSTILTLNHETRESTARDVLPYAIQRLQSAGYRLVTLAECVGQPAYQSFTTPGTPDTYLLIDALVGLLGMLMGMPVRFPRSTHEYDPGP
ncbi:unnamed protein product [Cyclocybe aegerita]|uniref:NodB homology domain-containing protein n=1 Tax=Cyclocybe aegerita TaxID=1973307 RepID=A0A8S0XSJ1_CYCAE|nr:unnamed protein product [Cyclocybe aegerita]